MSTLMANSLYHSSIPRRYLSAKPIEPGQETGPHEISHARLCNNHRRNHSHGGQQKV